MERPAMLLPCPLQAAGIHVPPPFEPRLPCTPSGLPHCWGPAPLPSPLTTGALFIQRRARTRAAEADVVVVCVRYDGVKS